MQKIWDNKEEKLSHEGKRLLDHISEIKKYLNEILNLQNLEFNDKVKEIINFIIEYHDYGKLYKKWNVYNKNNPPHSPFSIVYLILNDFNKLKELSRNVGRDLTLLTLYLIFKHHGLISKREYKLREIVNHYLDTTDEATSKINQLLEILDKKMNIKNIEEAVNKIDFKTRIDLLDLFGLFKIADSISAGNISENEFRRKFMKPNIQEKDIVEIITRNIKNSSLFLDNKRFVEQKKLQYLRDFGILRAYTGWGKTTTSLIFFTNKNVNRIFIILPTITAINSFYNKLNEHFGDKISKYFYFYDVEVREEDDSFENLFFLEHLVSPIMITTIDQLLLTFLQVGKYYSKRVMFRNSGLIIDEVHLLNPKMLYLLIYFIKKYKELYRFKILFMSATFPKALIEYLKEELKIEDDSILNFVDGYKEKRRIMFVYKDKDIEEDADKILEYYEKGKKVLVILNTVEKAISLTKKLKELKKDINLILLHSRFMYRDRKEIEEKIEELKNCRDLKKTQHVLVATQVAEVSLDINYDVLFTELAPIASLVQRFGRVNRYGSITNDINVWIYKPCIKNEKAYPYDISDLEDAKKVIKKLEQDNLKNEFMLLEEYDNILNYEKFIRTMENVKREIYIDNFENNFQYFFSLNLDEIDIRRSILEYRESFTLLVIPSPNSIKNREKREKLYELLEKETTYKNKSYLEKKKYISNLKEFLIQVPFWWIFDKKRKQNIELRKGFPVLISDDFCYDDFYGFVRGDCENEDSFII